MKIHRHSQVWSPWGVVEPILAIAAGLPRARVWAPEPLSRLRPGTLSPPERKVGGT